MLGSASPRNPSETTASRSSRLARAVVSYSNQFLPARDDVDVQAARTGIEAVLSKFLDDGRRTLHHFAGGDLVDQVTRELLNRHAKGRGARGRPAIFSKRRAKVLSLV